MHYKNLKELKLIHYIFSQNRDEIEKLFLGLSQGEKKDLIKFLKQEQVIGFIYYKLKLLHLHNYLSDEPEIKDILKITSFYNIFYLNYIKQISTWAEKERIKVIFFKGISLLCQFYPSIETRAMGDIDILIDKKDFEVFRSKLEDDGFEIKYGKYPKEFLEKYSDSFEFWRTSGDFCYSVDCHFNVLPLMSLKLTTDINIKDVFKRTKIIEFENIKISVLSWEDFIIFSSAHIWLRHVENVKLKHWIDLLIIFSKVEIDFEKLFYLSKKMKLVLPVYITLNYLGKIFNLELFNNNETLKKVKKGKKLSIYILNMLSFFNPVNRFIGQRRFKKYFSVICKKLIQFFMIEEKSKFLFSYFFPEIEFLKLRYPKYKGYGFLLYFVRFFSVFSLYN